MSIEFFSDYILITHTPSKLHLKAYTDNKFPVVVNDGEEQISFIYWHLIKNRDGEPDIMIPMLNGLKYFEFIEIPNDDFSKYYKDFLDTGSCTLIKEKTN